MYVFHMKVMSIVHTAGSLHTAAAVCVVCVSSQRQRHYAPRYLESNTQNKAHRDAQIYLTTHDVIKLNVFEGWDFSFEFKCRSIPQENSLKMKMDLLQQRECFRMKA